MKQKLLTFIFVLLIFIFFGCLIFQLVSDIDFFSFFWTTQTNDSPSETFSFGKTNQEKQTSLQKLIENLDTSSWSQAIFWSFLKKDTQYIAKVNWNQTELQKAILTTIAKKNNNISLNVTFKFYQQNVLHLKVSLKDQPNIFAETQYRITHF